MKATSFAALLIATLMAAPAGAGDYPNMPCRGWGWYGGGYHASTAGESFARGRADLIRSAGEYNLLSSQAALVREQARAAYIQNRVSGVQAHFDMKRINHQYKEETRRPPVTSERAARLAQEAAPDRANSYQLDPVTGDLYWPAVLRCNCFAAGRERLEALFATRQGTNAANGQIFAAIKSETSEMKAMLKGMIHSCDSTSYLAAKEFLTNLTYEARFAPAQANVASR